MDYFGHLLDVLEPNHLSQIPLDTAIGSINTQSISRTRIECKRIHQEPEFERRIRETTKQFKRNLGGLCLACVCIGGEHDAHT